MYTHLSNHNSSKKTQRFRVFSSRARAISRWNDPVDAVSRCARRRAFERNERNEIHSIHPRAFPARARASPPTAGTPRANPPGCDPRKRKSVRTKNNQQTPGDFLRTNVLARRDRDATDARHILNKKTYLGGSLGGHGGREDGGHRVCVRVFAFKSAAGELADSTATRTRTRTTRRTTDRTRQTFCPFPSFANSI